MIVCSNLNSFMSWDFVVTMHYLSHGTFQKVNVVNFAICKGCFACAHFNLPRLVWIYVGIGSLASVSFAILNALSQFAVYFTFLFSSFWIGCIKSAKAGMNLR